MVHLPDTGGTRGSAIHAWRAIRLQALSTGFVPEPVRELYGPGVAQASQGRGEARAGWGERPKGMHASTYERLLGIIEACEENKDRGYTPCWHDGECRVFDSTLFAFQLTKH